MIRFRHPHFPIIRLPAFSLRLFANININIAGTAVPKYLYGCALPVLVLRYPCYLYRLKFSSATARALPRPWYTCTTSTTLVQYKYCKVLCYNGRSSTLYYMYFYFHHFKVSYYNTSPTGTSTTKYSKFAAASIT